MLCLVRWVAGCERTFRCDWWSTGKQKGKSQTDGEGKRGRKGRGVETAYHRVSSFQTGNKLLRHFLQMTYSKNKKPHPSGPLPHSNFADVCCFQHQAPDSVIRGVAEMRLRETTLA